MKDLKILQKELDKAVETFAGVSAERSFDELIFLAMLKADKDNKTALIGTFPDHGHIFRSYKEGPNYFLEELGLV